jgi:hypothetical protein
MKKKSYLCQKKMKKEKDISEYFWKTKEIARRDINEYLRGVIETTKK